VVIFQVPPPPTDPESRCLFDSIACVRQCGFDHEECLQAALRDYYAAVDSGVLPSDALVQLEPATLACTIQQAVCLQGCTDGLTECRAILHPAPLTLEQKRALKRANAWGSFGGGLVSAAGQLMSQGVRFASRRALVGAAAGLIELAPVVALVLTVGGISLTVYNHYQGLAAADPPDPEFDTSPDADPPTVPAIVATGRTGVTPSIAASLNAMLRNQLVGVGVSRALVTTLNRASGAHLAGDANAQGRQLEAAKQYAGEFAVVISEAAKFRRAVAAQLTREGFALTQTLDIARATRRDVISNGFPEPFPSTLARFTDDPAVVDWVKQRILGSWADISVLSGSFPEVLTNPILPIIESGIATAYEAFSNS
jgi:hypothetical protein